MHTAFAPTAKKRCNKSGWRRCPGRNTVFPARKNWSKAYCSLAHSNHLEASLVRQKFAAGCRRGRELDYSRAGLSSQPLREARGAFATRPGSQVDNLRFLLVDDVPTT